MRFEELLRVVGEMPVFRTELLLSGAVDPVDLQRQLSRWTRAGRLIQFRRGLYALAPPYQKSVPEPFLVANQFVTPSYVSCQAALAYYSLIPESVPNPTSVTTRRAGTSITTHGAFIFRHVKREFFHGFVRVALAANQSAFVATPEKALLDLIYLEPGADSIEYLEALRLQNTEILNLDTLQQAATSAESPKLERAAEHIGRLVEAERNEFQSQVF